MMNFDKGIYIIASFQYNLYGKIISIYLYTVSTK